jgi:hypothetical protein
VTGEEYRIPGSNSFYQHEEVSSGTR